MKTKTFLVAMAVFSVSCSLVMERYNNSDNDSDADLDNDIDSDTDELVCGNGFGDCNDNPEDGCETDITDTTIHCGECNNNCSDLPGVATALCEEGECVIEECEEDYFNNDENTENGCEYACEITAGAHEISDDIDNDCDGEVDEENSYLVLYTSFDESSGDTVIDSSAFENYGILHNTVYTSDSIFGRAMEFDGTGYVEIPDSNSLEGFSEATWMLWIYPALFDVDRMSLAKVDSYRFCIFRGEGADYNFQYSTVGISGDSWATVIHSSYVALVENWALLIVTYDGSQFNFYVNGEFANTRISTGSIRASYSNLFIGDNSLDPGREFSGIIDEVAIYNRAWTPEEVSRYYSLLAPE